MEGIEIWLSSKAADHFDTDIQNLIPQCNRCFRCDGDYIGKYLKFVFFYIIISFVIACFGNSSPEVTFQIAVLYI
jgi:hypothetical protein